MKLHIHLFISVKCPPSWNKGSSSDVRRTQTHTHSVKSGLYLADSASSVPEKEDKPTLAISTSCQRGRETGFVGCWFIYLLQAAATGHTEHLVLIKGGIVPRAWDGQNRRNAPMSRWRLNCSLICWIDIHFSSLTFMESLNFLLFVNYVFRLVLKVNYCVHSRTGNDTKSQPNLSYYRFRRDCQVLFCICDGERGCFVDE